MKLAGAVSYGFGSQDGNTGRRGFGKFRGGALEEVRSLETAIYLHTRTMIIESLELKDYRNYESLNIQLSSGVNIFYGDNAQGKTNILESIYLATTSKSHRGSKDKDIIKFGSNESHIKLMIEKNNSSVRLDMHLKKSKSKGVAINGIPIRKLSELFGTCNVVFFFSCKI